MLTSELYKLRIFADFPNGMFGVFSMPIHIAP